MVVVGGSGDFDKSFLKGMDWRLEQHDMAIAEGWPLTLGLRRSIGSWWLGQKTRGIFQ